MPIPAFYRPQLEEVRARARAYLHGPLSPLSEERFTVCLSVPRPKVGKSLIFLCKCRRPETLIRDSEED